MLSKGRAFTGLGLIGTTSYAKSHMNTIRIKPRLLSKTKKEIDPADADGHVKLSILHENHKKYLAMHSEVLSATVNAQIGPATGEMTPLEKSIFQEGMEDILRGSIADLDKHDIEILSVIVTSDKLSAPTKSSGERRGVLNVQSVIAAQQVLAKDSSDSLLSEVEFGEMVSNAVKIFDHELMNEWKTKAEGADGDDDVMFGHLRDVSVQLYAPDGKKGVGALTIVMSSFIGLLVLCCLYLLVSARRRFSKTIKKESRSLVSYEINDEDSKDGLRPHKNIQDLIRGVGHTVTFAPYNDVQTFPPRNQKRNKYSKLKESSSQDDENENEDRFANVDRSTLPYPEETDNLPLSNAKSQKISSANDRFEDHPLPKSQSEDHASIRSNPSPDRAIYTIGSAEDSSTTTTRTANSLQGIKLALDGSALQGECFAPPGKLGVAIDTVSGHPVVHRVREDSPLSGVLRRLDVIVAVDEVDTTNMNAAEVTSLVAKRMNQTRKIRFMRGEASEDCLVEK